ALERRAAYVASVAGRRQVEQRLELRLLPELGRLELRICRQDALAAVVGAGRLAVVAAEDPRADAAPQLARHRARMLDRQVRDTAPRIDAMRSVERGRRAGVDARLTATAAVGGGRTRMPLEPSSDEERPQVKVAACAGAD